MDDYDIPEAEINYVTTKTPRQNYKKFLVINKIFMVFEIFLYKNFLIEKKFFFFFFFFFFFLFLYFFFFYFKFIFKNYY